MVRILYKSRYHFIKRENPKWVKDLFNKIQDVKTGPFEVEFIKGKGWFLYSDNAAVPSERSRFLGRSKKEVMGIESL